MESIVFLFFVIAFAAIFVWTINTLANHSAKRKLSSNRYGSKHRNRDPSSDSSANFWSFSDSGGSSSGGGDSCGGDGGGGGGCD